MPVPSNLSDLSTTAGSNSPAGSENPATADDYLRTVFSFIAQMWQGDLGAPEVQVASAATANIGGGASPFVEITGTTTITSFGTTYKGPKFLRFSGALTLTHNASTLILPGGASITTVAGDTAIAIPNGSSPSGWRVVAYQRSDGLGETVGAVQGFARTSAPTGWLKANGAAVAVASYPALASAIYCGDANNATAEWGYRTNSDSSPSTNRSTTGTYIVLPDIRGEFVRGWDDSKGTDSGRSLWSSQSSQNLSHNHTGSTSTTGAHQHTIPVALNSGVGAFGDPTSASNAGEFSKSTSSAGNHSHTVTIDNNGGSEARPRNIALLYCIKF